MCSATSEEWAGLAPFFVGLLQLQHFGVTGYLRSRAGSHMEFHGTKARSHDGISIVLPAPPPWGHGLGLIRKAKDRL